MEQFPISGTLWLHSEYHTENIVASNINIKHIRVIFTGIALNLLSKESLQM